MTSLDIRSNSAVMKRVEQLKRWEESDTNRQSPTPRPEHGRKIKFSSGCVFLASCLSGDKEEVIKLLENGADINTANVDGLTALHQACIDDNLDMVEFLVENGADINRQDNEGWTPLHATASCGFVSIARFLVENGADVSAVNSDGDLALDLAIDIPNLPMIEYMQKVVNEHKVDCEKARQAEEQMMLADAKKWLRSDASEVDRPHAKTGATALHVAAAKGYTKVISLLLAGHANVDKQDNDGWTPLHAAAHWGQKEAAEMLIDAMADIDLRNYAGQTCIDVADRKMVKFLEELRASNKRIQRRPSSQIRISDAMDNLRDNTSPKLIRVEVKSDHNKDHANDPSENINVTTTPTTAIPTTIELDELLTDNELTDSTESSHSTSLSEHNVEDEEVLKDISNETIQQQSSALETNSIYDTTYTTTTATNDITPFIINSVITSSTTTTKTTVTNSTEDQINATWRKNGAILTSTTAKNQIPVQDGINAGTEPSDVILRRTQSFESDEKKPISPQRSALSVNLGSNVSAKMSGTTTLGNTIAAAATTTTTTTLTSSATTPLNASSISTTTTTTTVTPIRRSFVPPTRDEESETQRKAHAKRVRETRRSTQGVTLDEIKSAEELVKKKNSSVNNNSNNNNSNNNNNINVNNNNSNDSSNSNTINNNNKINNKLNTNEMQTTATILQHQPQEQQQEQVNLENEKATTTTTVVTVANETFKLKPTNTTTTTTTTMTTSPHTVDITTKLKAGVEENEQDEEEEEDNEVSATFTLSPRSAIINQQQVKKPQPIIIDCNDYDNDSDAYEEENEVEEEEAEDDDDDEDEEETEEMSASYTLTARRDTTKSTSINEPIETTTYVVKKTPPKIKIDEHKDNNNESKTNENDKDNDVEFNNDDNNSGDNNDDDDDENNESEIENEEKKINIELKIKDNATKSCDDNSLETENFENFTKKILFAVPKLFKTTTATTTATTSTSSATATSFDSPVRLRDKRLNNTDIENENINSLAALEMERNVSSSPLLGLGNNFTYINSSRRSLDSASLPASPFHTSNYVHNRGVTSAASTQEIPPTTTTTTTTTNSGTTERRPSWRLKFDAGCKFKLEDASTDTTFPPNNSTIIPSAPAVIAAANLSSSVAQRLIKTAGSNSTDNDKENENRSPLATQAVIQRRRKPKRRSTGVVHIDMEDLDPERQDSVNEGEEKESGSERASRSRLGSTTNSVTGSSNAATSVTDDDKKIRDNAENGETIDYKVLWEAAKLENDKLKQQLLKKDDEIVQSKATIERITNATTKNSLSELEKRERRAMERKLSEMEEELKQLEVYKAENQRLKEENGALIRVISKLSK